MYTWMVPCMHYRHHVYLCLVDSTHTACHFHNNISASMPYESFSVYHTFGYLYVHVRSLIHFNIGFGYLLHTSIMHAGEIIFFLLFLLFISGHFHISIYNHMCFTVESCVLYLCSWPLVSFPISLIRLPWISTLFRFIIYNSEVVSII